MTRTMRRLLTLGLFWACLASPAFAGADRDALLVVDSYMASLIIGDTAGMQTQMTQGMRADRQRVLANPGYARTLQQAYAGATYQVVSSKQLSEDQARVVIAILLANDRVHVSFVLQSGPSGYQIASES